MGPKHPSSEEIHQAISCLRRLTEAFSRRRHQLASAEGLTEQQWRILEEISTEHFMPSMFARSRNRSAAAISKTLRQLGDKGLVSATVSKSDGRIRQYALTPKGKRVLGNLRDLREAAIQHVWQELDGRDLRTFIRFAHELTERLDAYALEVSENER
jgi:DNA-binding MarR family transcriptional regulator